MGNVGVIKVERREINVERRCKKMRSRGKGGGGRRRKGMGNVGVIKVERAYCC
jgi:hypothetical protein